MKKWTKLLMTLVLAALVVVNMGTSASAASSVFPKGYEQIPKERRAELINQANKEVYGKNFERERGICTVDTIDAAEKRIVRVLTGKVEYLTIIEKEYANAYIALLEEEIANARFLLQQKTDTWRILSSGTKIYAKQLVFPSFNSGKVTYKFSDGSEYKTISTTGEKEFTVIATDSQGNKAEKTVTINCKKGTQPVITLYNFRVQYDKKNKSFYTYTIVGANQYKGNRHTKYDSDSQLVQYDTGAMASSSHFDANDTCDYWFIAVDCDGDVVPVKNNKRVLPKKFTKDGQSKTVTFTATDKYNNTSKVKVKVKAVTKKKFDSNYTESCAWNKYSGICDNWVYDNPKFAHGKILVQVQGTKVVKEVFNTYTKHPYRKGDAKGHLRYYSDKEGTWAFWDYLEYYDEDEYDASINDKLVDARIPTYWHANPDREDVPDFAFLTMDLSTNADGNRECPQWIINNKTK